MTFSVVLAMHGVPPKGFPQDELMELFMLHHRMESAPESERRALEKRHDMLEEKMRNWPRTLENDPFFDASKRLAKRLSEMLEKKVFLGFNEFCAPSIEEALDQAAKKSPDKIIIITPMMTRGGVHSEVDIPRAVKEAHDRYPNIEIIYAWPYEDSDIARFLAGQVERFV